jgi:hypothetical protein
MKKRVVSLALLAASAAAFFGFTASAAPVKWTGPVKPMFVTLPNNAPGHPQASTTAARLVQWNGSFTDRLGSHISL